MAKGSYTPAPTEDPAEEQGIAPFSSIARGRPTPESCYPLIHIRRDERAGRDSQEAFAQRASEKGKGGGRCPATTTAALLDESRPPIREDQIPGPIPRTRPRSQMCRHLCRNV